MESSCRPRLSILAVVFLMAVVVAGPQASSLQTNLGITHASPAISDPPTLISVVRGADNGAYWYNFTAGNGWQSLGGFTASVPVLCSGSSSIEVVVRGDDNSSLWHKSLNTTTQTWEGSWESPGGSTQDQPACGVLGGTLYVVVRGTDNVVYSNSLSLASLTWSGWSNLGGATLSAPVLVSSASANRLDLIVVGTGNTIWHKAFIAGVWSSSWDSPQGATPSNPAAVSNSTSLNLVVRGTDNLLYYNTMKFITGVWSGWTLIGGVTSNQPVLAIDSSNTLHLLVVGTDAAVWHLSKLSGGNWGSTWDTAGGVTADPPAIGFSNGNLVAIVRGAILGIWSNTLVSSTWGGWTNLGGTTPSAPGAASVTSASTSCAQGTVFLGSAASFAILASSTVTNTGKTNVTGDVGLSPGTSVTGFPPGTVTGGSIIIGGTAAGAQTDLTTAYNDAQGRTLCVASRAGDLGGTTITPGLYKSTSSLAVTGTLTLDAQGNANAVFIFQMASTLTMNTGSQIVLTNGAQAKNIFWAVGSSATLGTTSVFHGTILAQASVTIVTGATLDGRALARTGQVSLDTNTVTLPT